MTRVTPPPLPEVGQSLKRLQWRHHRGANRRLAPLGLSLVQWDVLRHLDATPDASLHALAELTFQTDQSMGTLAARMVERRLIERQGGSGRAVRHRLTEAGAEALVAGEEHLREVLGETLGRLTPQELATLDSLLRKALGPGPHHAAD